MGMENGDRQSKGPKSQLHGMNKFWRSAYSPTTMVNNTSDSVVKNPPAKQGTQVQFLSWEDPLEKEIATHSSILDWEIP